MSLNTPLLTCFLIQLINLPVTSACLPSGICGPGLAGCPPTLQSNQALCQPGCPPGYHCGPYGCTQLRARARGFNLFQPNFESKSYDQLFMECCEDRKLPSACVQKCSMQAYTKDALINMYLNRDPCPVSAAPQIQFCAGQGRDHRQCCARNGVGTTLAGEKCLLFCDQRPGNVTQLDHSYITCYDRFDSIKSCFWQGMMEHNSPQRLP